MARPVLKETTQKIRPLEIRGGVDLPAPDIHASLVGHLEAAYADAQIVSGDIAGVLLRLLASARRRHIEQLPDITNAAEAA